MTDRQSVIDYIKKLEKRELLELFRAGTEDRLGSWFIGVAEHNPAGEGRVAPSQNGWDKQVLAPHDPAEYDTDWDSNPPFAREAWCSNCDTSLIGYAKSMKCPVCNASCYGH